MTENEQELLGMLRALADDGPREAPAHVRQRLLMEFRRRSLRRRRMIWLPASAVGAIAASLLILVAMPKHATRAVTNTPAIAAQAAASADINAGIAGDIDSGFYPLPEAEGLPPVENATVIRVQMPVESLQLMGLDINDESPTDPVQADILLGQDGLARAVRFVE